MEVDEIVKKYMNNPNFEVKKPCGFPNLKRGHVLPHDVVRFYSLCGGIKGYLKGNSFPIDILSPSLVRHANTYIIGEKYAEEYKSDISYFWYLIVDAKDGNYISIDCSLLKSGRCCESSTINHGIVGESPIIARSFTELLCSIYNYNGDFFYWKESDFCNYGDAYDNVNLI